MFHSKLCKPSIHVVVATILFSLLVTTKILHAQSDADENQQLFEWFDQLGFQDLTKLPVVKVPRDSSHDTLPHYRYGFLGQQTDEQATVHFIYLGQHDFSMLTKDGEPGPGTQLTKTELAEFANAVLKDYENTISLERSDPLRHFGSRLNEGSEFIVLARVCAAREQPELARKLIDAAEELLNKFHSPTQPAKTLQKLFADDLAKEEMWSIIEAFGDTDISRKQLLDRTERMLKNYPESSYESRAKETVKILRQMVAEDQAHQTPQNFDKLSTKEKVAELIFQLRDQRGVQISQPGRCDIFFGDNLDELCKILGTEPPPPSPAKQLVDIGLEAVPQLLDALDDQRFTRSVGYHRNFYFSHSVLRVSHVAETILEKIGNHDFRPPSGSGDEDIRKEVQQWWDEVQEKGELPVLIKATKRGNYNSPPNARYLVKKYPGSAVDAIAIGIQNSEAPWVRRELIEAAGQLGKPAASIFEGIIKNSPKRYVRITAAIELVKIKPDLAVDAMIAEWKAVTSEHARSPSTMQRLKTHERDLIAFLASSKSLDAIKALRDQYEVYPVAVRFELATAFGTSEQSVSYSGIGAGVSLNVPDELPVMDAEHEKVIESLLINAMADPSRRVGLAGNWDGYEFEDPRICDVAGFVLAKRLPDKYSFDPSAKPDVVEQQRIRVINQWRKENGMELLAEFKPRSVKPLPDAQTKSKLQVFLHAMDDQHMRVALNEIRELGIGTLPAIVQTLKTYPSDREGKEQLSQLANEFSTMITKVNIKKKSVSLPADMKLELQAMQGKPLNPGSLADFLTYFASNLPDGATGIKISIDRTNAVSAMVMNVELTDQWPPDNGEQRMWTLFSKIEPNENEMHSSGNSFSLERATERDAYERFAKSIEKALKSRYDQPLEIRLLLIRDK